MPNVSKRAQSNKKTNKNKHEKLECFCVVVTVLLAIPKQDADLVTKRNRLKTNAGEVGGTREQKSSAGEEIGCSLPTGRQGPTAHGPHTLQCTSYRYFNLHFLDDTAATC